MQEKKAANVLPEPVGAAIKESTPIEWQAKPVAGLQSEFRYSNKTTQQRVGESA